ncbi:MAG: CRISPR-associated protein Cas4 [Acidobacteria bacterium 13_1_20CM_3_53_8]|nr:MAG: CRISPR-associated protein Cas4 [Acidobacteria bacterium 13_1_20CM_3_53_8]
MIWLLSAIVVLLICALAAYTKARASLKRSGLPRGKLLYGDTGFPIGHLAPLSVDEHGTRQERPLISKRYGLVGRPDYLVRTREGIVPVEAKSGNCPASGRPYASNLMQLAAYCLLVEETTGARVPYGLIRYNDREIEVEFTANLREELLALLEEMREARAVEIVHRSHNDSRRCTGCSMRGVCEEAL